MPTESVTRRGAGLWSRDDVLRASTSIVTAVATEREASFRWERRPGDHAFNTFERSK